MARSALYPPSVKPGIPRLGTKPKGWIETTFGEVLQVIQRPADVEEHVEYQLVTAKRGRGGIVPREKLTGKKILTKIQYYVATGDFLISKRQIVHGACGVVPTSLNGALVSGEYSVLRVKSGLLLKFLDYFSHTDYFQMACFQASVGVDVEKMIFDLKDWLKVKIYLPSISEQEKIVSVINTWDKAIAQTEQLIVAKEKVQKGLMQQLLTGQVRLPRFNEKWQECHLGDLGFFSKGAGISKSELVQEGIPCIRYGEIYTTHHFVIKKFHSFIPKEIAANSKQIYAGDILFAGSGETAEEIGKCVAYIGNEVAYAGGDVIILRLSKGDPVFMGYLLNNEIVKRQKYRLAQGDSIVHIYERYLKEIQIPFPPIDEQKEIARALQGCNDEISLHERKLSALKQQKKVLIQKLITGQIRVKV
jgi:type I restriction enzyme S subunit